MKMSEGENCSKERRIQKASVCREAAEELSRTWSNSSLPSGLGCTADGSDNVFFNMNTNTSRASGMYAEICKG